MTDPARGVPSTPVPVRLYDPTLPPPAYAHPLDAGADLHASADLTLGPGERRLVGTGIAVALPPGTVGFVNPRSGLAAKHGITIVNAPGTIDAGYRGEIRVCLLNTDPRHSFEIRRGDRIAQLVIVPVLRADFVPVAELDQTARGAGGHGSTGLGRFDPGHQDGLSGAEPISRSDG